MHTRLFLSAVASRGFFSSVISDNRPLTSSRFRKRRLVSWVFDELCWAIQHPSPAHGWVPVSCQRYRSSRRAAAACSHSVPPGTRSLTRTCGTPEAPSSSLPLLSRGAGPWPDRLTHLGWLPMLRRILKATRQPQKSSLSQTSTNERQTDWQPFCVPRWRRDDRVASNSGHHPITTYTATITVDEIDRGCR